MAQEMSADAVRDEHIQALGAELGEVYHVLQNEVTWLHAKWLEYRKLYATSPQHVSLLNDAGAFFFRVVQDVLWDDVLLHLSRLMGPPKSAGKPNLTLKRLPDLVTNSELASDLKHLLNDAEGLCEFAKDWRNRHLAHRDFSLAMNDAAADPLAPASRAQVEAALAGLAAILNRIQSHYFDSETMFREFITTGGAEEVIADLGLAARAKARRRQGLNRETSCPKT